MNYNEPPLPNPDHERAAQIVFDTHKRANHWDLVEAAFMDFFRGTDGFDQDTFRSRHYTLMSQYREFVES